MNIYNEGGILMIKIQLLNKLTELHRTLNRANELEEKANELKEFELQIKSREVLALEKRNKMEEEHFELMLIEMKEDRKNKEVELQLRDREIVELRRRNNFR